MFRTILSVDKDDCDRYEEFAEIIKVENRLWIKGE